MNESDQNPGCGPTNESLALESDGMQPSDSGEFPVGSYRIPTLEIRTRIQIGSDGIQQSNCLFWVEREKIGATHFCVELMNSTH